MRLIDADKLIQDIEEYHVSDGCFQHWVEVQLTIAERKKGKWILCDEQRKEDTDNGNYRYLCSNCNYADIHAKTAKVPFCWSCGAKMEG